MATIEKVGKSIRLKMPKIVDKLEEKVLDEKFMIAKLWSNETIQKFCTNDLKEDKRFSKDTVLLMSNFSFLIKITII